MVQVPVSPNRRVQVQPLPQERFRYAEARNLVGPALEGFGEALGRAAEGVGAVEATYDEADATRIVNQYRSYERERLRSGDGAYLSTQGFQAGEGQQAAVKDLQDGAENLLTGARSERARTMARRALDVKLGNAQDQIAVHAVQQMGIARNQESKARIDGAVTDAIDTAGTEQFAVNTGVGLMELEQLATRNGWGPDQLAQGKADFLDQVHGGVLDQKFAAPDPNLDDIAHYLESYGGEMTPDLRGKTMARLQKPLQDRQSRSDADLVMGLAVPEKGQSVSGVKPNLDAITANAESGGREFTASGARVTSPAGARGMFQVMPATARDPGFGIKPSDGSPEQDARVGKQYRAKMEERYGGDLQKMWGAYNWGPGNVDRAVKAYGDNWLDHAPAETQKYVLANVAAAGGAGQAYTGTARKWDRSAIYAAIDKKAETEGWTPERTERARQEVDRRVARDEGLLKDQQANADDAAAAILERKGDAFRTSMIPRDVWASLSPTDRMQYEKIETKLTKPKVPDPNGDTVVALHRMEITNPAAFADPKFNLAKYRPFVTPAEFDELAQAQARVRAKQANPSNFDPRPKIDATISRQKHWSGIDVDKDATEGFRVRRYIEAQADAFRSGGKEPTQQDYDRWFADATRTVKVHRSFIGFDSLRPDTEKRASQILSRPYRDLIRRQFREVNGRWPNDQETQEWFEKMGRPG